MGKRILIVEKEPEPNIMMILESILPGVKTYNFVKLGNSIDNLPKKLDAVLIDPYEIPNSKELIEGIKDKYPEIPVIGFTIMDEDEFDELNLETEGVIYKPFFKEEFKEEMKKYISF